MASAIRWFAFQGQDPGPVAEFVEALPDRFSAGIISDVELVAEYELRAPVSIRSIKGHPRLFEIRTGAFRTFFVMDRDEMWVLECCRKDDQKHGIETAAERMRLVLER